MTRLVIVASSAVVRAGLEALAASIPGFFVVGALPDFEGAGELEPDVVVTTEQWDGAPGAPIVVLADGAEAVWTADAVRQGVRAMLPRDAPQQTLVAAIEAAASDMALVHPSDLEGWLTFGAQRTVEETPELTARERDVLLMMADGAANKAIAWKLGISEHTVKFHVASILGKLGAGTRTEAVAIAMRRGLVPV